MEQAAFTPETDIRHRIANNVAAELARHGYSKRAAALALGMTAVYFYRRLNAEVEFSGSDLQSIADLLEISPAAFFYGNEKTPPTQKSEGVNTQAMDYKSERSAEVIPFPIPEKDTLAAHSTTDLTVLGS